MNLLLIIILLLSLFPIVVFVYIIIPFIKRGAPYEKSSDESIQSMIKLSKIKKGEKVVDLGSGNGKILIEFAKKGATAYGFEINPLLVFYSRLKVKMLGLDKRVFIERKNFWRVNLKDFDVISLFQYKWVMPRLENKLKNEMKKGSRIVSNVWTFDNLRLKGKEGRVFLYGS